MRLTKNDTGNYLWGAPSAAPASIWSMTPVVDPNLTGGFLVGDFSPRSIELLIRKELITELSREHADYFVKKTAAIRTEARCANGGLYRPLAFVTGAFLAVRPQRRLRPGNKKKGPVPTCAADGPYVSSAIPPAHLFPLHRGLHCHGKVTIQDSASLCGLEPEPAITFPLGLT